jgi:hypothetical protein
MSDILACILATSRHCRVFGVSFSRWRDTHAINPLVIALVWIVSVPSPPPAVDPAAYLDEVLAVVEQHAYYADRVDWEASRAEAAEVAAGATTTADTYSFVLRLIGELDDRHSGFFPPSEFSSPEVVPQFGPPTGSVDDETIGVLQLPALVTFDASDASAREYISAAHQLLTADACGWIIDLRGNGGGNLFPMLVAVGPLLGPGPTVGYRDRHGSTDVYELLADGSLVAPDGTILAVAPPDAPPIENRGIPLAVLHGPGTASSGEGVVMALSGRPNVRTFGTPTAGVPTGNALYELSDGSALNLTSAIGVDFGGVAHEGPIAPDVPISPTSRTNVLNRTHEWLLAQPACAG